MTEQQPVAGGTSDGGEGASTSPPSALHAPEAPGHAESGAEQAINKARKVGRLAKGRPAHQVSN